MSNQKSKNLECLNCDYPLLKNERFCPECGQENKDKKPTLNIFLKQIFAGFISWDAKFWKTIIPLLTKPGKVTKDYIDGKRVRYANPFRFYLMTSIIFFLIVGLVGNYERYNELKTGKKSATTSANIQASDTTDFSNVQGNIGFVDFKTMRKFIPFYRKHPNLSTDAALDSLKLEKNLKNRFFYSRTELINSLIVKGEHKQLENQMLSYTSIGLFLLLPVFTLVLKLLYIRRDKTYIEHLIFVFHTQTAFFILAIIFYLLAFFGINKDFCISVFVLIFLVYLFIAMRKFYKQSKLKTLLKFCLANITFIVFGTLTLLTIATIAFTVY